MLFASFSFLLRFYTLTKMGAWRLVLKRGRPPFFSFASNPGIDPTEKSTGILLLRGTGWGKLLYGGIMETGKSGRQIYMKVKHEIFTTTHYYNTAGDFFARLGLSIIKFVKANPSWHFEIFT